MRGVLAALTLWFCANIAVLAQDMARSPLVGVMVTGAAPNSEEVMRPLREGLAALGDVEGRNLHLDFRFADGDAQRFPEMAEALVKEKASVIVVFSEAAAHAAQRATRTIPIIAIAGDFVAEGLAKSLAKPGGNITGVVMIEPELETSPAPTRSSNSIRVESEWPFFSARSTPTSPDQWPVWGMKSRSKRGP